MDIRIIETALTIISFFVLRITILKILGKIQAQYDYSKYRVKPILKLLNLFLILIIITILIGIWGVEKAQFLTFIASILTIVGVALFAQWSILSNITSALIIFISHPIKLGESITILDKDFNISGQLADVGLIYVTVKTESDEKIMIPNNIFLQKATTLRA